MIRSDKFLARIRKKRIQIKKKGDNTTDAPEMKKIIKQYYEELHTDKLEYLEEMENFLITLQE